jgi:tetratricopeptide (TPR) repeat protein
VAPFTLLSYSDVRRRAHQIAKVTQNHYMPPWLPEPGFGDFRGQRRLTPEQIALLQRWVDAGAPEGDPKDAPSAPSFPLGWQLGQPDLVLEMPPYTLSALGPNVFRNFVIPIPAGPRFVRAVEFRPGNPRVLHHAIMRIDRTGETRRLDERDAEPGFGGMDMGNAQPPDGIFLGWTPGAAPYEGGEGMAWRLEPGTDLVLQLHLVPSGKPEVVQPSIGLYYTDQPPTRNAYALVIQTFDIDIPAGRKDYVVEETFPLPVPVEVLGVYPHAHFLAKEMKVFATLPDQSTRWLLYIRDWDFNWQDSFRYAESVRLPKDTVITMRYTYDNSADNPRNPNTPPRRVKFGLESKDEMASVMLQLIAATRSEVATLKESIWRHLLVKNPEDPLAHYSLGTALCLHGKVDEGMTHLREAVRLKADYAAAHHNLGLSLQARGELEDAARSLAEAFRLAPRDLGALRSLADVRQSQGRLEDAVRLYAQAARMDPADAAVRYAWGMTLARMGRLDAAVTPLRAVLELRPDYIDAINNLGTVLRLLGRSAEAVAQYERALQLQPDNPVAHNNLGGALLAEGRRSEAIGHITAALRSRPEFPEAHQNLGDALAGAGRADEAIKEYAEAARLKPDWPAPLDKLAWTLATHPNVTLRDTGRAVSAGEEAARLTQNQQAAVLDTLAAAYAAAGRYSEAVKTADAALSLTASTKDGRQADDIRRRLALYRQSKPFRQPSPPSATGTR